jgi:hypothetical protein
MVETMVDNLVLLRVDMSVLPRETVKVYKKD